MLDKKFGTAGNEMVIEEFMTGREVSVLSFVDGIKNLYTIGRNGSHYCYKMDETVLNAMQTVDKIFAEHQK